MVSPCQIGGVLLGRPFVKEMFCYRRPFVTETFCYGDFLLWRRLVKETFVRRRFVVETFCKESFCKETFFMCVVTKFIATELRKFIYLYGFFTYICSKS